MHVQAVDIITNPWTWVTLGVAFAFLIYRNIKLRADYNRHEADYNQRKADYNRQVKIMGLFADIEQFIANTSSTSTQGQMLMQALISKIHPLISEAIVSEITGSNAWKQIDFRVSSDWEFAANNTGVNPTSKAAVQIKIEALIKQCLNLTDHQYRYEPQKRLLMMANPDIEVAKKPDIVFFDATKPEEYFCFSSEVYHMLELKDRLEKAVRDGRLQAISYALEVLKCQIELHQSLDRHYVIYASAACDSHIVFSKVELKDMELRIYSSGSKEKALPLVHTNTLGGRPPPSPPEGIKALLALLSTVPQQQHGALIGPYRLLVVLGIGGFCAAFRAKHMISGDCVAIKLPKVLAMDVKEARQALLHEFSILQELNHHSNPAIGRNAIPQLLQDSNLFQGYIVLANAGTPLAEFILRVSQADRNNVVSCIVEHIIGGLDYAHSCNICHCDLRVENIIVLTDEHGQLIVNIIDWGVACHVGEVHHHFTGGVTYFHDALVGVNDTEDVLAEVKFDFASLVYLEVALRLAHGRVMDLPWFDDCGTDLMVIKRREYVTAERAADRLEIFRQRPNVFEMLG